MLLRSTVSNKRLIFVFILSISALFVATPNLSFAFIDPGYGGYDGGYATGGGGMGGELCFNGIDDDGNGLVDDGC